MDDAQILALLADLPRIASRLAAIDTLVWAKTAGLAEVYRKEREWKKEQDAARFPYTGTIESGEGCPLNTGTGTTCGCPGDHVEFRPPTYEEEYITSPSGMPK